MSEKIIKESHLTDIANAIRSKLNVTDTYLPSEMATAIGNIPAVASTFDAYLEDNLTTLYDNTATLVEMNVFTHNNSDGAYQCPCSDLNLKTIHLAAATELTRPEYAGTNCSVETIILPLVKVIPDNAFQGFKALKKLDLGAATVIHDALSMGEPNVDTIIIRTNTVVGLSSIDSSYLPSDCYFYVPRNLIEAYEADDRNWALRFRAIEDYPDICG